MKKILIILILFGLFACTNNPEPPSWKTDVGAYESEPVNKDIPALEREVEQKQIFK